MANVPISAFTVPANTVGIGATGYSLTGSASASFMDLAGTWNTTGTPTLIKANVTDTASNAASLLMDLQVGGSSQFSVTKAGVVRATSGSAAAPSFAFSNATNTGIFNTVSILELVSAGTLSARFSGANWFNPNSSGSVILSSAGAFAWSSGIAGGGSGNDVILVRDTNNVLAQRNGVNAQAFRLYNTFTDASNYERLGIFWSGNICTIKPEAAGTGSSARTLLVQTTGDIALGTLAGSGSIFFPTNNTNRWQINSSGHLIAFTDNLYDIGASGATRPRSVYAGTSITPGAGVVVASLPTPSTGMIARVTDATLPVIGATVAGGGAAYALVNYNGANWTVIGV
jgi:hypothetical protein